MTRYQIPDTRYKKKDEWEDERIFIDKTKPS